MMTEQVSVVSRQRRYQKRKIALGLCQICGKEKIFKGQRCKKHYEYVVKNNNMNSRIVSFVKKNYPNIINEAMRKNNKN